MDRDSWPGIGRLTVMPWNCNCAQPLKRVSQNHDSQRRQFFARDFGTYIANMVFEKLVRYETGGSIYYGDLIEKGDAGFNVRRLSGGLGSFRPQAEIDTVNKVHLFPTLHSARKLVILTFLSR
jgi:hypothetical protein